MSTAHEFHYRMPGRAGGWRPGSHLSRSQGAGQDFINHARLFDRPDPRRLDLRASLRSLDNAWLVRVNRQRAGITVHALVDVSASMAFGARRTKLDVAADFVESLGRSAFRVGDAVGMIAFDRRARDDLFVPARLSRGGGVLMGQALRRGAGGPGGIAGLEQAAAQIAGRRGLVFVVSDFHWPLARLGAALDLLAHAFVVPLIVWDPAETEPPARNGWAPLHDVESGALRTLWLRPALRARWRAAIDARRSALDRILAGRQMRPFVVNGSFDADALSRYFIEATA